MAQDESIVEDEGGLESHSLVEEDLVASMSGSPEYMLDSSAADAVPPTIRAV